MSTAERAVRRFPSPFEVPAPTGAEDWAAAGGGDGELRGVAGSPGVVEGPARVILSVDQLASVRDGEVLVCPVTAPTWGVVFSKIRAAVVDTGGIMSHAAIVCREYGLPAVVGTVHGTRVVRTGDVLRVDGNAGVVTVLHHTLEESEEC